MTKGSIDLKRGDVYLARLDPTESSEQAGTRPVIIVSRDAINASSPVVVVVPWKLPRLWKSVSRTGRKDDSPFRARTYRGGI